MKRLIATSLTLLAIALPASAQDVKRSIEPVAGDVYLFRNNAHNSLVVVTSEGVVRVDPINADAGVWLNDNLSDITDQPITHLIWSHSHLDHASGGAAHPGAATIAHQDAPANIDGVTPTTRVGDSSSLTVGDKTFELTNLGPGHDNHMLAVVVRPENVAFIVDVAAPKRLPYRNFGGANIDDWIGQVNEAQSLDFEVFAPGHGPIGAPSDLTDNLTYLTDLRSGVLEGLEDGKPVEEIKATLTLDKYSGWQQYEAWLGLNIAGMADFLTRSGQVN